MTNIFKGIAISKNSIKKLMVYLEQNKSLKKLDISKNDFKESEYYISNMIKENKYLEKLNIYNYDPNNINLLNSILESLNFNFTLNSVKHSNVYPNKKTIELLNKFINKNITKFSCEFGYHGYGTEAEKKINQILETNQNLNLKSCL